MKVSAKSYAEIAAKLGAGRPYLLGIRYRQLTIIKGRGDSLVLEEVDEHRRRTGNQLSTRVALVVFESDVDADGVETTTACAPAQLRRYLTEDELERRPWLATQDAIKKTATENRLTQILLIVDENTPVDSEEDEADLPADEET